MNYPANSAIRFIEMFSPSQIGPGEVGLAEPGPFEIGHDEFGLFEVDFSKVIPSEVSPAQFGQADVWDAFAPISSLVPFLNAWSGPLRVPWGLTPRSPLQQVVGNSLHRTKVLVRNGIGPLTRDREDVNEWLSKPPNKIIKELLSVKSVHLVVSRGGKRDVTDINRLRREGALRTCT
jgi:hypothetical protein